MKAFALFVLFVTAGHAGAAPLVSRDDGLTPAKGTMSMGVFNPARYAATDAIEVQVHPLVSLVASHADVRIRHARLGSWQITGQYGLAMPTMAMKLLQGYLFPSFDRSDGRIGFIVVPSAGLLASHGHTEGHVFTIKADLAVGIPLMKTDLRPLQAPAPLDIIFAPALTGYRARLGVLYDAPITARVRMRGYVDGFFHGVDDGNTPPGHLAHFTFRAGGGVDLAIGRTSRLVLGVVVWNHFQHAIDSEGRPRRSTDPLPVVDFIWQN